MRLRVDSSFLGDVSLHDLPVAVQVRTNKGEEFSAVCTVGSYTIATMNLRDCQERHSDDDSQTAVATSHTPISDKVTTATRTLATAKPPSTESRIPAAKDAEPANKPRPAPEPEPTQTQSPVEPTATTAPTPVEVPDPELVELPSFGQGTHLVGEDIQPGLYRAEVASSFFPLCTWSRSSGLDGSLGSTIATKIINEGFTYVRIKETDLAFESSGCTDFTLDQPGKSPAGQFGPGTYLVGSDIHPGLYKSEAGGGLLPFCSWSRLSDVDGSLGSLIATDIVVGGQVLVEITATDFAFESTGCETWELQGEPATAPSRPLTSLAATQSPTVASSVYERTDGDSRTNCNPAPNEIAATPSPTPSAAPTPVATTTPSIGKTSFGPGTYLVGIDIQPGLYRSSPAVAGRSCYWERLSDTDGSSGSRIANELIDQGQTYVTIEATDFAFKSERCNEWELLAVPSPTPEPTAFRTPTETPSHTPTSTASTSPSPEPTPTPAPTATLSPTPAPPSTPAELVEQVRNGVVRVKARSGGILFGSTKSGSGFIFAVDGTTAFVATNHHVVEGGNSVEVQVGDSGDFEALVLGWDANKGCGGVVDLLLLGSRSATVAWIVSA